MRINLYEEELTQEVANIVVVPAHHDEEYIGVRLYLESPDTLGNDEIDDDKSAVTFWVKPVNLPWLRQMFLNLMGQCEEF